MIYIFKRGIGVYKEKIISFIMFQIVVIVIFSCKKLGQVRSNYFSYGTRNIAILLRFNDGSTPATHFYRSRRISYL